MNNKKSKLSLFLPYFVIFIFILFFANLFVGWPINSVLVLEDIKLKRLTSVKILLLKIFIQTLVAELGNQIDLATKFKPHLKRKGQHP